MCIFLGGKMTDKKQDGELLFNPDHYMLPTNFVFSEEGIGDIFIDKKDGKRITISFSDVIKALEEES